MKNYNRISQSFLIKIVVLSLCFLSHCKNQDINQLDIIKIGDNVDYFKPLKMSEICDSIEYIKLETNCECFIEQIKFLDITDRYIIIHDWNKCLLFDRSGKFLRQIGQKGRGPGEYFHPAQIRIKEDEVFIPDALDHKIKIFNADGAFIESIQSPGSFTNQFQINNYLLITDSLFLVQVPNFTGFEEDRLYLLNRNGEILQKIKNTTYYDLEKPRYGTPFYAQVQEYNGKIRYKEMLNDTVWQVEKDSLRPIYIFDRGDYGAPLNILSLPLKKFVQELSKTISIDAFWETSKFIFIKTKFGKYYPYAFYKQNQTEGHPSGKDQYPILGIYDKSERDFFIVAPTNIEDQICPTGLENDYDGGINLVPEYKVGDSMLISWLYPYEIMNYVSSKTFKSTNPKFPDKKKTLEKLANSLSENDNPVLMLVKLKE